MSKLMDRVEQSRLALNVGRTARLMQDGYNTVEIAMKLKQPLARVRHWMDIIHEANKNREAMK